MAETRPLISRSTAPTNLENENTTSDSVDTLAAPELGTTLLPKGRFLVVLGTLYFGTFLAAVDSTIVSTLLANIASDLEALNSISWAATSYSVAYSAFQPLYGKLSDVYGSRRVLIACTFIFGLGCQICSMANGMALLITGRFLNGIGAGGMLSVGSITVSSYVSTRDRGLYQGISNLVFGLGAASGGIIGSAAADFNGWRFAFSLQVPLTIISIIIIYFNMAGTSVNSDIVPEDSALAGHTVRRSSLERLDFVGSFSLASVVCLIMLAVTTGGNQFPWISIQIFLFTVTCILMAVLFHYWETHKALEPVLPIWLLTERTVLNSCLENFFAAGVTWTSIYFVPIYLAACHHYTPSQVSHRLAFQFVGGPIGSLGAGLIMRRTGKYWSLNVASAIGLAVAGAMWFTMPILPDKYASTWLWQGGAFFINGLAYVALLTITLVSLVNATSTHQATAISAQYTFRGTGSSVVLAVSAAIFNNVLSKELSKNVTGDDAQVIIDKVSKSVEAIYHVPEIYRAAIVESYRIASLWVFGTGLCLTIFVITTSLLIRDLPLEDQKGSSQ